MEAKKKAVNPIAVGAAAAMGVAVGAAAVVLSDPKNRKKVQKVKNDFQDWGKKTAKSLSQKAEELKSQTMNTKDEMVDDMPIEKQEKSPAHTPSKSGEPTNASL